MPTDILMPALSPTMEQGKLAKWLKKEGDPVKAGDVLAEIETDKATMEVEAVDEGVLARILVGDGTDNVACQHADRGDCGGGGGGLDRLGRHDGRQRRPAAERRWARLRRRLRKARRPSSLPPIRRPTSQSRRRRRRACRPRRRHPRQVAAPPQPKAVAAPEVPEGTEMITMTVREALRDAMAEEMRRDKDVFVMGEEVAEYQGAYKVTQGLLQEFGAKRVIDTPITEHGFAGLASGRRSPACGRSSSS